VKKVNVVTCEIRQRDDGRFLVHLEQTMESGKRVNAGSYISYETHEEAVERGTDQIKKFLMPIQYAEEELDLEMEEV